MKLTCCRLLGNRIVSKKLFDDNCESKLNISRTSPKSPGTGLGFKFCFINQDPRSNLLESLTTWNVERIAHAADPKYYYTGLHGIFIVFKLTDLVACVS